MTKASAWLMSDLICTNQQTELVRQCGGPPNASRGQQLEEVRAAHHRRKFSLVFHVHERPVYDDGDLT
jgi:hypothetical protein